MYRQLPVLVSLETLHMRNTARTMGNFPAGLESLTRLRGNTATFYGVPKLPSCFHVIISEIVILQLM